ncbi:hypothetical protein Goarm_021472 [Gossypium armourianum]|uniref:Uncharacterized protein n=1 Tax=Gossypium armourianum TaxID=34283 RepID=A0A7J9IRQ5_9ROSI|nr:hypothetical protein [Gossypium armourianum]
MEEKLVNLSLVEKEEDSVHNIEEEEEFGEEFNPCLVGRVLTNSAVHFSSLKNVLAEFWHPIEGDISLRAPPKRVEQTPSRWLREEPKEWVRMEKVMGERESRRQEEQLGKGQSYRSRGRGGLSDMNKRELEESYGFKVGREAR